ncbi:FAD-dependent monooxygenase [Streptomyces acidiscabies]|uniref:FAD-dependent monooxygenase n=1 Tax=Streptomyces acidiscabies TaxID=42234 RepID=A0AAP6BCC1_9ACTN|nr:FAD-dependent monooxygenase [Streptomyces acidiscabies]MBP5935895.1 NAD(P)-binding protein [Streptomyces sp. LBUM 1476]MBZ3916182.1 FAD-dependent monooxygenase [Streptomyces acidiscabies]MDX2962143.1 FAD-dependent monooxygenase [Streptomyces acidiscabies]MDX3017860.1 FAD-dependent monooxygenase [Streptomyces acidiscabies]MDX3791367.1 FAD-dependent monooxygenase [Streptomyces acidiscabies]
MSAGRVAVVGAGPAGLVLAALLHRAGIDVEVWERGSRRHVEQRARAGMLEHRVVDLLAAHGLADRLLKEGERHGWCDFLCLGERTRVDYGELSGGYQHWVYPQQLLVRDLVATLEGMGCPVHFDAPVRELDGTALRLERGTVRAEFVIGCDGVHGVVAGSLPDSFALQRRYPYDWLTVLADMTHPVEGVLYAVHEAGFAGRMPRAGNVARLYLQVPADDDPADWPEGRVREQLALRLAPGPGDSAPVRLRETGMLRMRGRVRRRLRSGPVLLAGDAAHLLTPSGAKGLNLAVADAADLADGLIRRIHHGDDTALAGYEARRLAAAWWAQDFSDRLLDLLHLPTGSPSDRRFALELRRERIRALTRPGPYATAFGRDYAGAASVSER